MFYPHWINPWILRYSRSSSSQVLRPQETPFSHHCPHFLAVQLFQTEIFGDRQLLRFTFDLYLGTSWPQSTAAVKIAKESVAIQAVSRQDVNIKSKWQGTSWSCFQKTAKADIWVHQYWRQILRYFKLHFHNEGRRWQKTCFEVFSGKGFIYISIFAVFYQYKDKKLNFVEKLEKSSHLLLKIFCLSYFNG